MTKISAATELRFRTWLKEQLAEGKIPTPTDCLRFLGKKDNRSEYGKSTGGPLMAGVYVKIRTDEFLNAGLVKERDRWRRPA